MGSEHEDPVFGKVIFSYTRAQAIEDGVLKDVTEWAGSNAILGGGFICPVAFTAKLWNAVQSIPANRSDQDVRGRAHDVIWMALVAGRKCSTATEVIFQVILPYVGSDQSEQNLRFVVGPGDSEEMVVTIGFEEDEGW